MARASGGILKPNLEDVPLILFRNGRDNETWGNEACRGSQCLRYLHRTRFSSPARNPQRHFITVPFVIFTVFVCLFFLCILRFGGTGCHTYPERRATSQLAMDGMTMTMATATTSASSLVAAALETSSAPLPVADSSSMSMQTMSPFVHFSLGDPFLTSILTPMNSAGYVAILFLLMMLSFLQRSLSVLSDKADQKCQVSAHAAHRAELEPSSGSWMEKDEEKQPITRLPNKVTVLKASRLIGRSMLVVLNAAVGYMVYVFRRLLLISKIPRANVPHHGSMLAVMTLNAGYMTALLVGVFIGELVFGRHRH